MKNLVNLQKITLIALTIMITTSILIFKYNTSSVNNSDEIIKFEVTETQTYLGLANVLKSKNLIKSEFFYKIYIKLYNPKNLQTGTYNLKSNMSVKELIETLNKGTNSHDNLIKVTFVEGFNMRNFIKIIEDKTDITKDSIVAVLKDKEYLDDLIEKYWFLTNDIKNSKLYYSLEGYLYPNTYELDKNWDIKKIIETLLNETNKKLSPYKDDFLNSQYSVHEIITLASIIELEAGNSNDTKGIASVFYNRLKSNWTLGSDVTTYYAEQKDFSTDLTSKELYECNAYNTRGTCFIGLPVGPISNPSITTIESSLNPTKSNYYYFVADKNGKTYYSKTDSEHVAITNKLKNTGLWYEYN